MNGLFISPSGAPVPTWDQVLLHKQDRHASNDKQHVRIFRFDLMSIFSR